MENDVLLQLGVGGMFAVLLVREVLGFLKRKNGANGLKAIEQTLGRISKQLESITKQMHEQVLERMKADVEIAAELRMLRKELERRPCQASER